MNNTPAFPTTIKYCIGHDVDGRPIFSEDTQLGMTLRDYFAAQALSGLLADEHLDHKAEEFARLAYKCADAMLEARESTK